MKTRLHLVSKQLGHEHVGGELSAAGVRLIAGARGADVGLLELLGPVLAATAAFSAAAAASLAGQGQALQLAQVHACEPDCRFEVFEMGLGNRRIAA